MTNPSLATVTVKGIDVLVDLMVTGNEAYARAVEQAMNAGQAPRAPTQEEVGRAVEAWRRDQGRLDGFRKERVQSFRTFLEPNRVVGDG